MNTAKRPQTPDLRIGQRVLTGLALWSMVALLCALLANAVAAGLPQ